MTKRKASVALDTGNESNQSSTTQDNNSNSTSATNTTTGTNTNSGVLNGISTSASAGGKHQVGGSQGKSKKERADNWSNAEIQVLHRGIETRRDVFYGPPNQATKKNRELAWESITKEVNSVSTTPRSLSQVMKKFKNEKCRAKRKFIGTDKNGHNSLSSSNNSNSTTNNTNISAQNHANNNQQLQPQQQPHHLSSTNESMPSQTSSINVVKLAPQNVAKTMIDLPNHVQQIQMPNDDMVLTMVVPPEMDGLLSGMNIVSDALNNQQHTHHSQHTIQAINTGQGIVNGTMTNGMMARTIPAGSMCSLVYSTGPEVCGGDQQITSNNVPVSNQIPSNHLGVNAQNLMHHRTSIEQNPQGQQQQQQQQQQQHQHQQQPHQHHQQLHQHQQQTHQHQQAQHPHQSHQHPQHHPQQNHLTITNTGGHNATGMGVGGVGGGGGGGSGVGGIAIESQLKNLLFNLLIKDGQHSSPPLNPSQDYSKQRNDILAIIASSLNKIEGHLGRISKVAGSLAHNISNNSNGESNITGPGSLNVSINMSGGRDNSEEGVIAGDCTNNIDNQGSTEA